MHVTDHARHLCVQRRWAPYVENHSGDSALPLGHVRGLPLLLQDGSTNYVYGPGGLPLEQISGTTTLWLQHDQLGSTRLVTDSTGVSRAAYTYDPYGNVTSSAGTITNPFGFSGEYKDSESASTTCAPATTTPALRSS